MENRFLPLLRSIIKASAVKIILDINTAKMLFESGNSPRIGALTICIKWKTGFISTKKVLPVIPTGQKIGVIRKSNKEIFATIF